MSNEIDILKLCLKTPGSLSPVVVGAPGIGKTQRIKKLAADMKWQCEILSPGERGEGAFGVVPVPNGDGYLHYPAPDWVKRFDETGEGLLFIDEINTAPPALQPALLGLLLDGRIGGHQLPPGVRRAAAMNPTSHAAAGWDLPAALANRMQYLMWGSPTAEQWTDWLLSEADGGELAMSGGSGWTAARALASAYHRKNPGRLSEDPDKVLAGRFPPAFSSPRSWETAIRMLAACQDSGMTDQYPGIAEGILGKPVSVEWCVWLKNNDLPDPEKLLADPSSWQPNAKEMDKVFATCFAVAECACKENFSHRGDKISDKSNMLKKYKKERWHQAWRVIGRAAPLGKGMIILAVKNMCSEKNLPQGAFEGEDGADARRIAVSLKDVAQLGGIL